MDDCELKEHKAEPPGSSYPFMKNDSSKSRPPDFSNEAGPSDIK